MLVIDRGLLQHRVCPAEAADLNDVGRVCRFASFVIAQNDNSSISSHSLAGELDSPDTFRSHAVILDTLQPSATRVSRPPPCRIGASRTSHTAMTIWTTTMRKRMVTAEMEKVSLASSLNAAVRVLTQTVQSSAMKIKVYPPHSLTQRQAYIGFLSPIAEQMRQGTVKVREALGSNYQASDKEIQEALWHYYYDVSKSVAYIKSTYCSLFRLAGHSCQTFTDSKKPKEPKKPKTESRFDKAASSASQASKSLSFFSHPCAQRQWPHHRGHERTACETATFMYV